MVLILWFGPMRTDVITALFLGPRGRGASAVCGNKLTSHITVVTLCYIPYNVSFNHCMPCIQMVTACLAPYSPWTLQRIRVLGLQLPLFLDLLGVVLQMSAHDALYEAREVGTSIS